MQTDPGDISLLREYAAWLQERDDPRGEHLAAELSVREAQAHLIQSQATLYNYRGSRAEDFKWLDTVLPMTAEAPTDGTFYAAPAPEDPPFILPENFCHEGTVIGIIEAVKIFYKIPAGHSGVVAEVLVSNGDSVASGDPIVKLARPQEPPAVHGNSR